MAVRSFTRVGALLMGLVMVAAGTWAASEDDAASGTDAGNTKDSALKLATLGYYQANLTGDDTDWFSSDHSTSDVSCVRTNASGGKNEKVGLTTASSAGNRTVPMRLTETYSPRIGIAGPNLHGLWLEVAPKSTGNSQKRPYDFTLSVAKVPSLTAGDALSGIDAGETLSTALEVSVACFGGHIGLLDGIQDLEDVYTFTAAAGDTIWYSLGATDEASITVRLLNATGNAVGYAIQSGDLAGYYVEDAGTFYLSTSTSTSLTDIGYMLGLSVGPDPGNGCRPNCLSS